MFTTPSGRFSRRASSKPSTPLPPALCRLLLSILAALAFASSGQAQTSSVVKWLQGGHSSYINYAAYAPNAQSFLSASRDGTVKLWRTSDWQLLHTIRVDEGFGYDLAAAYSPDSKLLVTGYYGVELHDAASGKLIRTFGVTGSEGLTAAAFTPDGQYVAAIDSGYPSSQISQGFQAILWRVSDGKQMLVFGPDNQGATSLAVSPDGKTVALGGNSAVKLYRLSDGARLWSIGPLTNSGSAVSTAINSLTFSPDGRQLAIGCDDQTGGGAARLVDASTGALQHILGGAGTSVHALVFTPDGQTVLNASDNSNIGLWDAASGHPIGSMTAPLYGVPSIAVSPDGQKVVAGGFGSGLNVYDLPNRVQTSTSLTAHFTIIETMALSSASGLMATAELAGAHL